MQGLREFSRKTSAEHKAVFLFLLVLGIALRAVLLTLPITFQEAETYVDLATEPALDIIADHSTPFNHVLNTLLIRLSTGLFGVGLVPIRLPGFLASVLCMPLFYFFVRAMFNRTIALIALAMVACSGPLLTTGALATGHALCCFFFVTGLLLGRHFIKTNDLTSATLIAVVGALGLWVMPAYAYAALALYFWILTALIMAYTNSLRERIIRTILSFVVLLGLALLLYTPILQDRGLDQLTNHHAHPRLDWKTFDLRHTDMAFALWSLAVDATAGWITMVGLIGVVYAAFTSSKLRALLFAQFGAGVILCVLMRRIEPVEVWSYVFFSFHLSSAISLFYLLKFLQEKVFPNWQKRSRTAVGLLVLIVSFGWTGYNYAVKHNPGLPQAEGAVALIEERLRPGDKFYTQHPWDAPIRFLLLASHGDVGVLEGPVASGGTVMVAVGSRPAQTLEGVLRSNGQDPEGGQAMHMVQKWPGLKIFAAP